MHVDADISSARCLMVWLTSSRNKRRRCCTLPLDRPAPAPQAGPHCAHHPGIARGWRLRPHKSPIRQPPEAKENLLSVEKKQKKKTRGGKGREPYRRACFDAVKGGDERNNGSLDIWSRHCHPPLVERPGHHQDVSTRTGDACMCEQVRGWFFGCFFGKAVFTICLVLRGAAPQLLLAARRGRWTSTHKTAGESRPTAATYSRRERGWRNPRRFDGCILSKQGSPTVKNDEINAILGQRGSTV